MPTSSPAFDAPLAFEAGRSRVLASGVASAYGLAALGLAAVPLAWSLAGWALLAAGLVRDLPRVSRRMRLRWEADGSWWLPDAAPAEPLWLCAPTFVSRWLVVLDLRAAGTGRRHRVVLARDSVSPVAWRRLVARLRVEGPRTAVGTAGWQAPGGDP